MEQRLPDRWLRCPRHGTVVAETPFLPFKVPLDGKFDGAIPPEFRWGPLNVVERFGGNMRVIFDLTKSRRYYDFTPFESQIQRVHLPLEGHDHPPTKDDVTRFISMCDVFVKKYTGSLIGIHCTHGYNRTGFLIVSYMVERLDFSVDAALANFLEARDPGIYKREYVAELYRRYGEDERADALPEMATPEWAYPDETYVQMLIERLESFHVDVPVEALPEISFMAMQCVPSAAALAELARFGFVGDAFRGSLENPKALAAALRAALPTVQFATAAASASRGGHRGAFGAAGAMAAAAGGMQGEQGNGSESPQDQERRGVKRRHEQGKEESREDPEAQPSQNSFPPITLPGGAPYVAELVVAPLLGELRRTCREMIGADPGTAFPGMQPVSLDKTNFFLLDKRKYLVSWKADGTRFLMLILGVRGVFMIGRDNNIFRIHGLHFPSPSNPGQQLDNTLVDGELVHDKWKEAGRDREKHRFLLYDAVVVQGQRLVDQRYSERLRRIDLDIVQPRERERTTHDYSREVIGIRKKEFFPLESIEGLNKLRKSLCHENDGFIFGPDDQPYIAGTCELLLKYKPPHLNSVDFKFHVTSHDPTSATASLLVLSHGGTAPFLGAPRSDIKVSGSKDNADRLRALDGKIVECTWSKERASWQYLKVRTDKTHPNGRNTAEKVFRSICDGIEDDVLRAEIRRIVEARRTAGQSGGPPGPSAPRPPPGSLPP